MSISGTNPCPFCGCNELYFKKVARWTTQTIIVCNNCRARGPEVGVGGIRAIPATQGHDIFSLSAKEIAIIAWNRVH